MININFPEQQALPIIYRKRFIAPFQTRPNQLAYQITIRKS